MSRIFEIYQVLGEKNSTVAERKTLKFCLFVTISILLYYYSEKKKYLKKKHIINLMKHSAGHERMTTFI